MTTKEFLYKKYNGKSIHGGLLGSLMDELEFLRAEKAKFSYTLCGDISKDPNYSVKYRLTKDQFDEICEKYGFNLL